MKITLAKLNETSPPVVLDQQPLSIDANNSEIFETRLPPFHVEGEGSVEVMVAITTYNSGGSIGVEQDGDVLLNSTFGISYIPSFMVRLKNGTYIQIQLDLS